MYSLSMKIGAAAIPLALLVLIPLFLPRDLFKDEIEARLSSDSGREVTIESIELRILPSPRLVAHQVKVKPRRGEPDELSLASVQIYPALSDLLRGRLRIKRLHLQGMAATWKLLAALAGELRHDGAAGDSGVALAIEHISGSDFVLYTDDHKRLGPYRFDLLGGEDGLVQALRIVRVDGAVQLDLSPHPEGYSVRLQAKGWRPSLGPPFLLDALLVEGIWHGDQLTIPRLHLQAYGGEIRANLKVSGGERWTLHGDLATRSFDVRELLSALGVKVLSGRLGGRLRVQMAASNPGDLLHSASIQGHLTLTEGLYEAGSRKEGRRSGLLLKFNSLTVRGHLEDGQLDVTKFIARGYGGEIDGDGRLSTRERWRLKGRLNTRSLNIGQVLSAFGMEVLSGTMDSRLNLDLAPSDPAEWLDHLLVEGHLRVKRGAVYPAVAKGGGGKSEGLPFGSLLVYGKLKGGQLDINRLSATAYRGKIQGHAAFSWRDGYGLRAQVTTRSVDLRELLSAFKVDLVSGRLDSRIDLRLASSKLAELLDNPLLKGHLRLSKGIVRTVSRTPSRPPGPEFRIKSLELDGGMDRGGIAITRLVAEAYEGRIAGNVKVSYGKGWRINGRITTQSVDLGALLSALQMRIISGHLNSRLDLRLAAAKPTGLLDNPTVKGQFQLTDGVIYKADLKKASMHFSEEGLTGGETPFQLLGGRLAIADRTIQLTELKITSSALEAKGRLTVDGQRRLDGEMDVGLLSASELIGIPVVITGTLDRPFVRPATEVLAGAAIGTMVLGPGVGTAIGLKAGAAVKQIGDFLADGLKSGADQGESRAASTRGNEWEASREQGGQ